MNAWGERAVVAAVASLSMVLVLGGYSIWPEPSSLAKPAVVQPSQILPRGVRPMAGCTYWAGLASVTYMTKAGSPVVTQMFDCGNNDYRRRYLDYTGRELGESELVPALRYQIADYLEEMLGVDIDLTEEIIQLEAIATARGLI